MIQFSTLEKVFFWFGNPPWCESLNLNVFMTVIFLIIFTIWSHCLHSWNTLSSISVVSCLKLRIPRHSSVTVCMVNLGCCSAFLRLREEISTSLLEGKTYTENWLFKYVLIYFVQFRHFAFSITSTSKKIPIFLKLKQNQIWKRNMDLLSLNILHKINCIIKCNISCCFCFVCHIKLTR